MYNINLVQRARESSEGTQKAVKLLRLLSLLVTLSIFALIGYTVYTIMERDRVFDEINELKIKIDEVRRLNKVKDVENEWTLNYHKLLAISDMIANNTKTGLMLREAGLYMPANDYLCSFELLAPNTEYPGGMIKAAIKAKVLENDPKYDINLYHKVLMDAYERSLYIGTEPIKIENREQIEVQGRKVDVLNLTMPFVTEKK